MLGLDNVSSTFKRRRKKLFTGLKSSVTYSKRKPKREALVSLSESVYKKPIRDPYTGAAKRSLVPNSKALYNRNKPRIRNVKSPYKASQSGNIFLRAIARFKSKIKLMKK